jgi:TetR/AcrR family transcriptional regulator, tetracycline repressor protein
MGRPSSPLLTRRQIIGVSLEILERDGLQAFTMRRLAKQLNVNGASIYHYFASKEDILESACRASLGKMMVPGLARGNDWVEWLAGVGLAYRAFLIDRPYMVPLMVAGYVPRASMPVAATAMARMRELGMSPASQDVVLKACDALVYGSALVSRNTRPSQSELDLPRRPTVEDDAVFLDTITALIRELTDRYRVWRPNRTDPSPSSVARGNYRSPPEDNVYDFDSRSP